MRISIFGSGYVGLVQAAVFADVGHRVICMDIDAERVDRLIRGEVPFFEPGLSEMVIQGVQEGLLTFTRIRKQQCKAVNFYSFAWVHRQVMMAAPISDMS